jgi:hypothetical protein
MANATTKRRFSVWTMNDRRQLALQMWFRTRLGTAKSSKILTIALQCVALLGASPATMADGVRGSEELTRTLGRFFGPENSLTGYLITARETNLTYTQFGPAQAILNSGAKLSPKTAADARAIVASLPLVVTNITAYTYRFGPGAVLTSAVDEDDHGQAKSEKRILATSQYLLQSRVSLQPRSDRKPNVPDGKISRRIDGVGGGWPLFLNRATLGEIVRSSPKVIFRAEALPSGEKCSVLEILGTSNTPIAKMKLLLTTGELKPLELSSYLPDGTIYSRATLHFTAGDNPPGVCRFATCEQFSQGHLYRRSVWHLESVGVDEFAPQDTPSGFFAPFSSVADERFSRSLTYMVGSRLPNDLEIAQMLTNRHAIARFEAKTLNRSAQPTIALPPPHLAAGRIMVLLALALTMLISLLGCWFLVKPGRTRGS